MPAAARASGVARTVAAGFASASIWSTAARGAATLAKV
jgi:hypothetical protein